MKYLTLIILSLPLVLFGQNPLSGIVIDSSSNKPVPDATVYINGTTNGTTTNSKGIFEFKNVTIPSQLIISHISFFPKMIYITSENNMGVEIRLKTRTVQLSELLVKDKSLRRKNVYEFKRWFIGIDDWGQNAVLKNDSSLVFNGNYENIKVAINPVSNSSGISIIGNGDTTISYKRLMCLRAKAKTPLLIDLPLLGYMLQVELIDFEVIYGRNSEQVGSLGYYYFKQYPAKSKLKLAKYERNRRKVYYNSSQHFFRSLFSNSLMQNGYRLAEEVVNDSTKRKSYRFVNIDTCVHSVNVNLKQIVGLNGKHFIILYYGDKRDMPIDLMVEKGTIHKQSDIYFFSDTCLITSSGTTPDNSIIFGGVISEKKAGAILPDDYSVLKK